MAYKMVPIATGFTAVLLCEKALIKKGKKKG